MVEGQIVLGTVEEDGLPVIWRYVDRSPSVEERERLQWLTVISWPDDRDGEGSHPEGWQRRAGGDELEADARRDHPEHSP